MATTAKKKTWGALPAEWDLFLGMVPTADLLPVVSNPDATISPHSKIAGIGKTPSHYNGMGHVAGLPKWTEQATSPQQVAEWRKQTDYGICIQTRSVRAFDIDVADREKAHAIVEFLQDELLGVPMRFRENSGKCLLAVVVEGELPKRMVPVEGGDGEKGMVEFLGNGQQIIAAGTHPSGVRYQWDWMGLHGLPAISLAHFESTWAALVERFGIGDAGEGGINRKKGKRVFMEDSALDALEKLGLVLGYGREGQAYIDCPWKDGHSGDTGIAQTAYFPKGSRGYEQGHFHCFHASCSTRTDGDYLCELGVVAEQFEVLAAEEDPDTGEEQMPMPRLVTDKQGDFKANALNVNAVLERPDVTRMRLRFDTFRDEIMWSPYGRSEWQPFLDEHNTELRIRFDRAGFNSVSKDLMRDCVHHVAIKHKFDSAIEWLGKLQWDGKPRVGRFAARYLGCADTRYTEAVSFYLWSALAGRILEPGVQANMVPILVGAQGTRKSSAVLAMAPDPEFFVEVDLGENAADLARRMRGRMVGELSELQGLRTRQLEAIKAFITRLYEDWVPKYKEFATSYARRIVFVGTSNEDQFLSDETGNRRWLPMRLIRMADPDAIARDRDQLWAEARELYELIGVDHRQAETLARDEHDQFRSVDAWEDVVTRWLASEDMDGRFNNEAPYLRNADIMQGALNITADKMKRADEMRLGAVMPQLGYERKFIEPPAGKRFRAWVWKDNA